MTYEVAIPSHHRARRLAETTIPVLLNGKVDPSRITVYVSMEDQRAEYERTLAGSGVRIVSGHGLGMRTARNFIANAYEPGTRLVQIDDDITRIIEALSPKTKVDVEDVDAMFREGFDSAGEHLWCVYPVKNPMFMWGNHGGATQRGRLWYAEGCLFGYVVRGEPERELVMTDDKEDFERSIRFFLADGEVVRMSRFSFFSAFYTEPGGMQDYRTTETLRQGSVALAERWPDLARIAFKGKEQRWDLRLKAAVGTVPPGRSLNEYPDGLDDYRAARLAALGRE